MPKTKTDLHWPKLAVPIATVLALTLSTFSPALACCSLAPANFSETKGYMGEAHLNGKLVHVLAYQNTPVNYSQGGNAMFLPIPAKYGTMNEKSIVDTKDFPHILDDMKKSLDAGTRSVSLGMPISQSVKAPIVFNSGIYTIVLAQDPKAIPEALARVPANKRPKMNAEIFAAYEKWYPGWTFALCCFDSKDAVEGNPMLWWYEPLDKDTLFFPALDAHTGKAPALNVSVPVDHVVMFSVDGLTTAQNAKPVNYSDFGRKAPSPELKALLPKVVTGADFNGVEPQGDFSVKIADVKSGKWKVSRILPPGAVNSTNKKVGSLLQTTR